jgi:hypothetical protein
MNRFEDAVEIFHYIGVPETENRHAALCEPSVTPRISLLRQSVLTTIKLDCQTQSGTIEI